MREGPYAKKRFYDREAALAYAGRSPGRHRAEVDLLRRILEGVPGGETLDVPCGTGRLGEVLAGLGCRVTRADLSAPMLHLAGGGVCADAARLPFRDRAFDLVVCHRFLHHLRPAELEPVLGELARVTGRHLVLTFFHPCSLHGLARRVECLLRGRPSGRFTTRPRRLARLLAPRGLRPLRHAAQRPYLRELWSALFVRPGSGPGQGV